jgi:hypothetical protein
VNYVVHKSSRAPAKESYAGIAWLGSKLVYRPQYQSLEYATRVAEALTKKGPDDYVVSEVVVE